MNEFAVRIPLTQGLRSDPRVPRNSPALVTLKNAKPSPVGLVPIERVVNPFDPRIGSDANWPLPQLFKGRSRTFLADRHAVYFVNEEDWSLYPLDLYLYESPNTLVQTLPIGNPWQLIESYDSWLLTNGQCVVFSINDEQLRKVYVVTNSVFETGCEHRGRFVVGGFDPENAPPADWQSYLRAKVGDTLVDSRVKEQSLSFGGNFVLWSSIGGGDFPFWLWHLSAAKYSYYVKGAPYGDDNPLLFERMRHSTFGFMVMPWQGRVRVMKPLGDSIVVYGDHGIALMFLAQTTYGLRLLKNFGIHAHAVGGDESEHVFMDGKGNLWRINAQLQFELLGYREFLYPMMEGEVQISYVGELDLGREYVISDGHQTYHLTQSGLCQSTQSYVTSAIYTAGGVVGVATHADYLDDNEMMLCTDWTDFGEGLAIKKVGWIQLGNRVQSGVKLEVAVDYRFSKHEDGRRSRFTIVNNEGAAYVGVSGTDFRIVVKCDQYQLADIDEVVVRYQRSDRRYVRSVDAINA